MVIISGSANDLIVGVSTSKLNHLSSGKKGWVGVLEPVCYPHLVSGQPDGVTIASQRNKSVALC